MDVTERFAALATLPDAEVPLDEAALLIAAHADRDLQIDDYLTRLDDLATACPAPTLDALVLHLFGRGRYRGNADDYYDPRNSFISDVIDRRIGIPITLSVLAIEVGRRLGVPLSGVGMPGHFLVRNKVDPSVFIDPFHDGRMLDATGCRRIHEDLAGSGAPWDPAWLTPVGPWSIIARMLANLQAIYGARQDDRAMGWVLTLRALLPGAGPVERSAAARHRAPLN